MLEIIIGALLLAFILSFLIAAGTDKTHQKNYYKPHKRDKSNDWTVF